jgi:hypothetical protein
LYIYLTPYSTDDTTKNTIKAYMKYFTLLEKYLDAVNVNVFVFFKMLFILFK